ncbi:MAG: alkaline phosphatase [Chthoniobacteraceae bacterium]
MKLRNQLLALACIVAFLAAGYLYVRTWVVQKPFGIIVFLSDGVVTSHLTAARLYEGGADHELALERFPHVALLRNPARDFAVPDDAAAGTAFATGQRGNHRHLSVDSRGRNLQTIVDLARAQRRSVGLVTNGSLTSPTAAAFYAHTTDSTDTQGIARQLVAGATLDVMLGGGAADFLPESRGGRREDGRDLLAELQDRGVEILMNKAQLEEAEPYRTGGIMGLFSSGVLSFSNQAEAASQQPSLPDMVRRAIAFLQQNRNGYLLIVDAALVTTAAERNEGERAITETLALDQAVDTAMSYAGERSLIIAAGKHSTGGMSLNGYPLRQDHGVALLGSDAAGHPALTWATGPNGPAPAVPPPFPTDSAAPPSGARTSRGEPAAFQTQAALSNAEDVLALGRGEGAEAIRGWMDNTQIFEILKNAL